MCLQMLKVNAANRYETAINQTVGVSLSTSWVDVPDPDPIPPTVTVDGVTASAVFKQGFDAGGARFRRLEGIWEAAGQIYFDSTNGGGWFTVDFLKPADGEKPEYIRWPDRRQPLHGLEQG